MPRRYVKHSTIDALGNINPKIVAVVSTKGNLQNEATKQTYYKRNYLEALRKIIPPLYFDDEQEVSGTHISFPNQLINSHILANKNQSTILPVSALTYDNYLSAVDNPSGFARFFYKQNSPATITPDDFQRNFLYPRGVKFSEYRTSASFVNYLSATFLPSIPAIAVGHHAAANLATLTASSYANDSSGTYKYLANNLGWIYFLNRLGPTNGFDPSTGLATLMTETLWKGRTLVLEDSIKLYEEYLWKNEAIWGLSDKIIPIDYVSAVDISGKTYASGTQLLDRLKTLTNVVYSPHFLDSPDTKVADSFNTFLSTSSISQEGTLITETLEAGPLARFLEAMSFTIADTLTEHNEIGVLYDIAKCPDEYLDLLAELIGWRFLGADIDKWRVQLRNAVRIYKMKGTKRSVQLLLDTLFSTGVFNVNTSGTLIELWESYIPDLLYYSLATSSPLFTDFDTYTEASAARFGVPNYSVSSMETNIKYAVDKILLDLFLEFPTNFRLGTGAFPQVKLRPFKKMPPNTQYPDGYWELDKDKEYAGPYHIMGRGSYPKNYVLPDYHVDYTFPVYMTGTEHTVAKSQYLGLSLDDPNFIFKYRNVINFIPPYEKRKYYMNTQVTESVLERIKYHLNCFGVETEYCNSVLRYLKDNTTQTLDTDQTINNFLLFTKEKQYPPNYARILKTVTQNKTPDPVSLLSLWNGKSSHFLMRFDSSSFNWTSAQLKSDAKYGIKMVKSALDQVIPAHAIPEIIVSLSAVADAMVAIADNDCREIRPNFYDLYEGSSTVTTNFGTCAVNMAEVGADNGLAPHRFKRADVESPHDPLFASGLTNKFLADTVAPRNSLRRRNFHNLLPETKMFTRVGKNNPGSLELSTSYYSSSVGFLPLGFIPSSLKFQEIPLVQNPNGYLIGKLLDHKNLHVVWDICQNLSSPSSIFGYDISNTFPSRVKQNISSSDCNTYGRRGQLPEILYTMNKLHDKEKYLQASSIVSGYLDSRGAINPDWPTSNGLITPTNFADWYAQGAVYGGLDVPKSIGNHLINKEATDKSLNYLEHFKFGYPVQRFYNVYNTIFSGHGTQSDYNLMGVPNIYSHTYGPLIYNSQFDVDGSGLETSGYLAASSPLYEVDLSYFGGSGVLSISGTKGDNAVGTYAASNAADVYLKRPEFRNTNLVSAIELVDTSSPASHVSATVPHPTFSIFKLSRDNQSRYSFSKYLINNQIIKYHRSDDSDLFPRLRVKIDNSNSKKSRNFLEPDHVYEVTVKAHNLEVNSLKMGGLVLGCWIHTEPENNKIWSYVPKGVYNECTYETSEDRWVQTPLSDLSGADGINIAKEYAQTWKFPLGQLDKLIGHGETKNGIRIKNFYDDHCWEPYLVNQITKGGDPLAISNINEKTRHDIKFKFSTMNNIGLMRLITEDMPVDEYYRSIGKVHRTDQKYVLEFFVMDGASKKFIVFEDISIQDLTNYNKAIIDSTFGPIQLDVKDLKSIFRYFKDLHGGIASRNTTVTSGTMELSGGSRLNYRSNIGMYPHVSGIGTYGQFNVLTELDINEG